MSELHKELSRIEFEMRENSMTHTPVENEMRFYEAVKRGDMDAAKNAFHTAWRGGLRRAFHRPPA